MTIVGSRTLRGQPLAGPAASAARKSQGSAALQVVLHVDENSSPEYKRSVRDIALIFQHVSLVTHPVPCNWGGAPACSAWAPY